MATHSIYEILTRLVERVTWSTEAEKVQMLASVEEARKAAALGAVVSEIACAHEMEVVERYFDQYGLQVPQWKPYSRYVRVPVNQCIKCGREVAS